VKGIKTVMTEPQEKVKMQNAKGKSEKQVAERDKAAKESQRTKGESSSSQPA
jgi:hypothetical protein